MDIYIFLLLEFNRGKNTSYHTFLMCVYEERKRRHVREELDIMMYCIACI